VRLHAFDDYPFHQTAEPFDRPATSDSHFNDGYYFAFFDSSSYFACGMRWHPNNNALDGFAGIVRGGEQRNLRFSRALRPRYDELRVGPLSLEILEPMRRHRLVLAAHEQGFEFDVQFTASAAPIAEDRDRHHRYGKLINDVLRVTQVARAHGRARIDGHELPVERWHAIRDHSWGIRTSMGPQTPIGGIDALPEEHSPRALRIWLPFEVEDHCGLLCTHEDSEGRTVDFEGRLDYRDGRSVELVALKHDLTYHPGTRVLAGGRLALTDGDGNEHVYSVTMRPGAAAYGQGFGYSRGFCDGRGAGIYRGAELVEGDRFDVSDPQVFCGPPHVAPERRLGPVEFPCEIVDQRGNRGMGNFEHVLYGPYARYGL
jgi:hypothetical protein